MESVLVTEEEKNNNDIQDECLLVTGKREEN